MTPLTTVSGNPKSQIPNKSKIQNSKPEAWNLKRAQSTLELGT